MRILWFSITPSLYFGNSTVGSWIESLERIVRKRDDVQLAIAFESNKPLPKKADGNVTYYPLYNPRNYAFKACGITFHLPKRINERYIDSYTTRYSDQWAIAAGLKVIEEFKPDVIQCFGSEWPYGLLAEYTKVPIVIHMQGFWPAYRNVNLSQTATRTLWDVMHENYKPQLWWRFLRHQHLSKERAQREEKILAINRNYMGRTRWDKAITQLYAPNSNYFYCSEALRDSFITSAKTWKLKSEPSKCTLVTVGNWDMIKGYDLTLQTAKLLKEYAPFDFEWKLIGAGADAIEILRRKLNIVTSDVNITLMGHCSSQTIVSTLLESDIFIQTSWIDNSPNAVCEAQYMGMPIITTNVGGVPSLFADDYAKDLFVPLHDPYYLAAKIIELYNDTPRMQRLSESNYTISHSRHDDKAIEQKLFDCYYSLTGNS